MGNCRQIFILVMYHKNLLNWNYLQLHIDTLMRLSIRFLVRFLHVRNRNRLLFDGFSTIMVIIVGLLILLRYHLRIDCLIDLLQYPLSISHTQQLILLFD
jgi:lipid-A-disaccharide synthase-like uncharacterized protein